MTAQNFGIALRAFLRRRPLIPFFIELHTGERLRVSHPEAIALRGQVAMYIDTSNQNKLFDHESVSQVCDLDSSSAS